MRNDRGPISGLKSHVFATLAVMVLVGGCTTAESIAAGSPSTAPVASIAATPTASPSPSPSAAAGEVLEADHVFGASVPGYAFVELPRSIEREARRQFQASAGVDETEAELDLRSLTRDGTGMGLVLVVALSPEFAALPGTDRDFAVGMGESAGSEPEEIELGARTGYVVTSDEQTIAVAWQDHNLLIAVFAERRGQAIEAARAIVEATG